MLFYAQRKEFPSIIIWKTQMGINIENELIEKKTSQITVGKWN